MKAPTVILVPDTVSNDTIDCLQTLLLHAKRGEVIGLGFVAVLKKRRYIANTAGQAHTDPTLTRGMLMALDDKLSQRIAGGNP